MDSVLKRQILQYLRNSDPKNSEVEFRFHNVDSIFYSYVNFYLKHVKGLTKNTEQSTVYVAENIETKEYVRMITTKGKNTNEKTKTSFMSKNSLVRPFMNKNFKISVSKEENITTLNQKAFNFNYKVKMIRKRNRTSYKIPQCIFDISEVEEYNLELDKTTQKYEVEIEILTLENKDAIFEYVNHFVQNMQINNYKYIVGIYNNALGLQPNKFGGPLPFTLLREKFDDGVLSCGYSVTDKADGERYHMITIFNGATFLMNRNKELQYIGQSNLKDCIIDGELVDKIFYAFDSLFINNVDLTKSNLIIRLEKLGNYVTDMKFSNMKIKVTTKTFYYKEDDTFYKIKNGKKIKHLSNTDMTNIGELSYRLWKNRSSNFKYELDGLIFTPILKNYFNYEIFKWKPVDTVDFHIKKIDNTTIQLSIAGHGTDGVYKHLPFSGYDKKGSFYSMSKLIRTKSEPIQNKMFHDTNISKDLREGKLKLEKKIMNKFSDNSIVEFKFNSKLLTFVPLKERKDKKFANGIATINDIWESLKNPIKIQDIKLSSFRSCIRPFHNEIKNSLIQSYMKKKRILDIGFGAGGDIHKYSKARVKEIVGLDIVDTQYTLPSFIKFIKVSGDTYDIKDILAKNKIKSGFDVINIQFAVHYFFRNDNVLNNLINNFKENLVVNGKIVMTLLDGNKVTKLMNGDNIKKGSCGSTDVYELIRPRDASMKSNKLKVKLYGTAYFKEPSNEYLVDISGFIDKMNTNGFKLLLQKSFQDYSKDFLQYSKVMCKAEKEYSYLNTSLIFTKLK